MKPQAALRCVHLYSPDPERVAEFYCASYGMNLQPAGDRYFCIGAERRVGFSPGPSNKLRYAHFASTTADDFERFAENVSSLLKHPTLPEFGDEAKVITVADPDGNIIVFTPPMEEAVAVAPDAAPPAVLQHLALRTPSVPAMMAFYETALGFTASDLVQDDVGDVRAGFLRRDELHHALALCQAPAALFDHQSFETSGWDQMKEWADHMAARRVPIVWGIGRHGPGNDLFFMVRDPDGNLAEISAEIERCDPGRPAGHWVHEERTLNLWGKAIMRS